MTTHARPFWRGRSHETTDTYIGHAERLVNHARMSVEAHRSAMADVSKNEELSSIGIARDVARSTIAEHKRLAAVYNTTLGNLRAELAVAAGKHRDAITVDLQDQRRAEQIRGVLANMNETRRRETLAAARNGKIAGGDEIVRAVLGDIPLLSGFDDADPILLGTRRLWVDTRSPSTKAAVEEIETAVEDLEAAREFLTHELTEIAGASVEEVAELDPEWAQLPPEEKAQRVAEAVRSGEDPRQLPITRVPALDRIKEAAAEQ